MDENKTEKPENGSLRRLLEVLWVALRLGLTSFGGPIAHLGYFRDEYVVRRKWLDEHTYSDVVALCQILPGPASSQVGITVGIMRGGLLGGIVAWLGFTLPSAIALVVFAYGIGSLNVADAGWLHGLKIVAVPVVAQAVWGMARVLTPDKPRITLAIVAAIATLAFAAAWTQVLVIVVAALIGWRLLRSTQAVPEIHVPAPVKRTHGIMALVLLAVLLIGLPIAQQFAPGQTLAVFDSFFRVGALVFGGGHVVLPLLQHEVVLPGWVTNDQFLAGYGAAQAVPGPLFTFSAYLGVVMLPGSYAWLNGGLALVAIFLPSFLFIIGGLRLWSAIRGHTSFQAALRGVNAAVVGLLLAALYQPVWTSAVKTPADFSLALALFGLLVFWRVPPWLLVVFAAIGGAATALLVR
ncbi:MAG: chromate efflux transporter [Chloroflexi bacterium]|nr:chromate efflux transporter [Chloroflexota bacterium]